MWSQNDVIMSWLRLPFYSNCIPHPSRHIQSVSAHQYAVHSHMVAALLIFTHPTWLRLWWSGSLVETKLRSGDPPLPSQHQLELCLQCQKASACHLAGAGSGERADSQQVHSSPALHATRIWKCFHFQGWMTKKCWPSPPLPAPARAVLVTPKSIGLPLSWSWIRGEGWFTTGPFSSCITCHREMETCFCFQGWMTKKWWCPLSSQHQQIWKRNMFLFATYFAVFDQCWLVVVLTGSLFYGTVTFRKN